MAEELAVVPTPSIPAGGQIGFKQVMGVQEPYLQRKAELQKGITAAEGDEAKAKQAQAETLQTGKLEAQQAFGTAEKGAMQGYQQKLEEQPLPAFVPTKDNAQDLAGLFSLVSIIGMIAGKSNGQMAMQAMNGMLEGYQKGRQDLYKKEAIEFDKNFKAMLSKHAEFRKEMENAIKLAATDKEAGMQAAELAATKAGSSIVQAQLRKGDLVGAYKLVDESSKGAEKALTLESTMRQKAADRENAIKVASARSGGAVSDINNYIQKFTGSAVNKKDAPEIMTAANAIGDAYAIKQSVADHPEWVGRTGQIKNFFNKTLESINAGEPPPSDEGQPELIFAKRYAEYLVNYERALAGNARGFTVQFQKRFNSLLDQNQFNATGMDNLMNEQIRTITSKAAEKSPTINRQNLTQIAYDLKTRAEDEAAVKGMATSFGQEPTEKPTGKPMPTGDKIKAYADTHFDGDEEKAKDYLRTQGYK